MGFRFRRSKKFGPFRVTLTNRGVSTSVSSKIGPVRVTAGKRGPSVSAGGLTWTPSRGRAAAEDLPEESASVLPGCLLLLILGVGLYVVVGAIAGLGKRDRPAPTPIAPAAALDPSPSVPVPVPRIEAETPAVAARTLPPAVRRVTRPDPPTTNDPYRTWSSASGRFSVRARLLDYVDSAVRLLRADGKTTTVKTALLSDEDRAFVSSQKSKLIAGLVVSVYDGDTLRIEGVKGEKVSVRLSGIDAPERPQDFGRKAAAALRERVLDKKVRVRWSEADRYDRVIGDVYLSGEWVNLDLVRSGWAWHFKEYSSDPDLDKAESAARDAKLGLWADSSEPEPPWAYRDREEERRKRVAAEKEVAAANLAAAKAKAAEDRVPFGRTVEADRLTVVPLSYWLNTSTGVRHSRGCRHYGKTSSGRYCSAGEGKPCGQCGG